MNARIGIRGWFYALFGIMVVMTIMAISGFHKMGRIVDAGAQAQGIAAPASAAFQAAATDDVRAVLTRASRQARASMREQSIIAAFVGFVGILIFSALNYRLKRTIIDPLAVLCTFIDRYTAGDRYTRLPSQAEPGLNTLAQAVNRLVDRVERFIEQTNARAQLHRQLASSLIEQFEQPAAILDTGMRVRLSNEAARAIFAEKDGQEALRQFEEAITKSEPFVWRAVTYQCDKKELSSAAGKWCGWLVIFTPGDQPGADAQGQATQ
ncbi:hypothetical protein GX586_13420 [bacterium]|nr:hypothetical protein [bacterium]